jgi:hypothetical protein
VYVACRQLRRRAILVLACLLLALARPSGAHAEPLRPVAALVQRMTPLAVVAPSAAAGVRRPLHAPARVTGGAAWPTPPPRAARAGGSAEPDGRYVYLRYGKLLC